MTDLINIDLEIMGGVPCFRGSRVPVVVLFYNLANGLSLDEIFNAFPSMPRKQILLTLSQEAFPFSYLHGHVDQGELMLWKMLEARESARMREAIVK
jgi:uncharacterized protein (DUF433 family)